MEEAYAARTRNSGTLSVLCVLPTPQARRENKALMTTWFVLAVGEPIYIAYTLYAYWGTDDYVGYEFITVPFTVLAVIALVRAAPHRCPPHATGMLMYVVLPRGCDSAVGGARVGGVLGRGGAPKLWLGPPAARLQPAGPL